MNTVMAAVLGILGQPLYTHVESLDWMAAKAEVVVRARVTEFIPEPKPGRDHRFVLTLGVEETLKGKHENPRRADIEIEAETLRHWKDDKAELLLFLPLVGWSRGVVALEGKERPEIFTSGYKLLRNREEVLRKAKEAVGRAAGLKSVQSHSLMLPAELVRGTQWFSYYETSGAIDLVVPVDERLEKQALDWIKPGDGGDVRHTRIRREQSIQALAYFKSESNINVLRALLNDPDTETGERKNGRGETERYTLYPIREEAQQVLTKWGVKVSKP
jgi:hypothetical protein